MIYPRQRAVLLVLGAAPPALALGAVAPGAWLLAAGWVAAMVVLTLADALLAPRLSGTLHVAAPGTIAVGDTVALAPMLDGSTIVPQFAAEASAPLEPVAADPLRFHAPRRGTARIARIWARSRGPLGLAWRQRSAATQAEVRVLPDLRPARDHGMRQFLRDSTHGSRMRTDAGEGAEFQALVDFQPGMERRAIDWKASARQRVLLAREFRAERNNAVVFAIDCGRAMGEPIDGLPRVDRAVSAALLSAFVALKSGDQVRLFAFDDRPRGDSGTAHGIAGFAQLQRTAAAIDYSSSESNHTRALVELDAGLRRRSLILLFTEFTDPTGAELLIAAAGRLLRRHRVLFVLFDDVELDAMLAARPADADDVVRATVAGTLLRERRVVVERLRRLGIEVIAAAPDALPLVLAERYARLRERW